MRTAIAILLLILLMSPVVSSSEQLVVEVEHQFIQILGENIEVFQVIRFVNYSKNSVDEVYIGLWPGYVDVSFLGGRPYGEVQELAGGIVLSGEILPGDSLDITLMYYLPLEVMGEYLGKEIRYSTDNFFVLVDSGQLSLRNTELFEADLVSDGNVLWQQYYALKIPAGETVGMVLAEGTGMVLGPANIAYNQELPLLNASHWGFWLFLSGLFIAFAVHTYWQKFHGSLGREHGYIDLKYSDVSELRSLQKDLMARLLLLEEKFSTGELSSRKYREEKTLKSFLAEVTLAIELKDS